jgi:serine/threonine protein phosphatase 1
MVLKRLTAALGGKAPRPSLPEGERVYAIGDLHGRRDLLDAMLDLIAQDEAARGGANTTLVFLGDLVDRGPDSRGVLDRLIALRDGDRGVRFLCGNHDEVFLKALKGDAKALRFLTRIGGKETILSYGIDQNVYDGADYDALAALVDRHVPGSHLRFLEALEDRWQSGDYLFVHAGIRPGVPVDQQKPSDLRWIREDFLSCRTRHPHMVVHGHSITSSADVCPNRIGIDTGAFASGRLTALGLEGTDSWFITATGAPDPRWGSLSD